MKLVRTLRRLAHDAPLYLKIAGVGSVAIVIIAAAALLAARAELIRSLSASLERETDTMAEAVAVRIEQPLLTGTTFDVERSLADTRRSLKSIRYIVVRGPNGSVVAESGDRPAEGDFVAGSAEVFGGMLGQVELTMDRAALTTAAGHTNRVFLLVLALGGVLALIMMSLMTWSLSKPVMELVETARRVRDGELGARIVLRQGGEVGELATAFNEMVASLATAQRELEQKERIRERLIERLIHAQEGERARLARELHDGLGQSMSAMLMALRVQEHHRNCGSALGCNLDQRLVEAIDDVRRMSRALRPSVLDDHGLASALRRHAADISGASGIAVACEQLGLEEGSRLARDTEVVLYRIAQEALSNVVRHSEASRASLVLVQRPGEVRLIVEDDGRGFCPQEAVEREDGSGFGLSSMRERARLAGGTIDIESSGEGGTALTATIPIATAEVKQC